MAGSNKGNNIMERMDIGQVSAPPPTSKGTCQWMDTGQVCAPTPLLVDMFVDGYWTGLCPHHPLRGHVSGGII